ncbi:twin-arginine translocation signal domain-containing protein [Brucella sp. 10RB9214]|uniref:twin-arginine translocation signal domain-containing protein n=1 Tax=unclassified Brucella TaxID=2632610 RepID=UPI000972E1BC|nr:MULTISPECIES: twin-arginine translocation signal domain-containing protein [unclassified Brucella]APY15825.1 hypothetical protein BKD02_16375 [Brucella sp. 09RB8910]MRN48088.1 twin-arginine translocation signal domain-containing protein [Brucella sp. 10RB9212]MRN50762.1 twin-arginine translocation signal domain-containing protein [Brucella sp. 10RB9214]
MKRRAFLKFLGVAPVAAAVPAMALPRAEKPTGSDFNPEITQPLIFHEGKLWINSANIGTVTGGTLRSHDGETVVDLAKHEIEFAV